MNNKEYAIVALIIGLFIWLFISTAYAPYEHSEETKYDPVIGDEYGHSPYSY